MTNSTVNEKSLAENIAFAFFAYLLGFALWMGFIGGWFWVTVLSVLYWFVAAIVLSLKEDAKAERAKQARERENRAVERALFEKRTAELEKFLDSHYDELVRAKVQLLYKGRYGEFRFEKWDQELKYFVENVLPPKFSVVGDRNVLAAAIDKYIVDRAKREEAKGIASAQVGLFDGNFSGVEFEQFCASLISEVGLGVRETPASGDHGVDLIAVLDNGDTVAIQCKMKATPVGNSAVQEVVAGRTYYRAAYGAVVSNNTYTRSARQLAESNGIGLIHFEQLQSFLKEINEREANNVAP